MHLVGKDILRFHAVIWPAMLLAAGVPLPKTVFAHGWLLVGGEKMSKSKLTAIPPSEIVDVFGSDAFRYYFLRAIEFGQDGSFSWEDLSARYKAELADQFGNLASRLTSMVGRYRDGVLPAPVDEPELSLAATTAVEAAEAAIDRLDLQGAILAAMDYVRIVNNYVTEQAPWQVAKDESRGADLDRILYATAEALRVVAVLLHPVMPKASTQLWQLARRRGGAGPAGRRAGPGRVALGPAAGRGDRHQERAALPADRRARAGVTDGTPDGPTRARGGRVSGPRERPPAPEPLRVPVADSHCHLDIADPPDDWLSVDDALAASTAAGVPRIVQIGCDLPGARWAVETARRYDELVAGVALHPNEAPLLAMAGTLDSALAEIDALAADPVVRAVGESGLDHFRTGPEGRADQEASFRAHIEMANRHGKALVIHDRDAHDDVIRVLEDAGAARAGGLPLLLRRRRDGRALRQPRLVAVLRRHGDLQERRRPARGPRALPAGPAAGRDRRSVPHAGALPRPAERLLPGAAHAARDGRGARRRRGHAGHRGGGQHRGGIWHLVTPLATVVGL